jgi:hypothetical protein
MGGRLLPKCAKRRLVPPVTAQIISRNSPQSAHPILSPEMAKGDRAAFFFVDSRTTLTRTAAFLAASSGRRIDPQKLPAMQSFARSSRRI